MAIVLLLAVSLLPFVLGGVLNWYIMTYTEGLPPLFLIGVLFLLLWGAAAFFGYRMLGSAAKVVLPLNAVGFVVLVLVGVQELVLTAYWQNAVGLWTQYYFLPLIRFGTVLSGLLFGNASLFLCAYCPAFLLMLAASAAGCWLGKKSA